MAKGKKLPPGWEKYANSKSNNIWKEKNKQRNPIVKEDVVVSDVSDELGNDENINIETITTDEAICETVQLNDINENFNIEVEEEDLAIEDQNITELESVNTYEFNSDYLIENIKATPTCSDSEIYDIDENTNIEIITTDEDICETVQPNDISESINIEVEEEDLANDGQNITEPESGNIDEQFEGMVDKYSLGISVKSSSKKKNKKKFVVIVLILLVFVIAVTSVVVVLAKKNNSKQKNKFQETEYVYIPESSGATTAYEEIITDEVVEEPVSDENVESSETEIETETEKETETETEKQQPMNSNISIGLLKQILSSETTIADLNKQGYELSLVNEIGIEIPMFYLFKFDNTDIHVITYISPDEGDEYVDSDTNRGNDNQTVFVVKAPMSIVSPERIGDTDEPYIDGNYIYYPNGSYSPSYGGLLCENYEENKVIEEDTIVTFKIMNENDKELFDKDIAHKKGTSTTPYAEYNVGDVVMCGRYEQDDDIDNGTEDIVWRIHAVEEDKVLLISAYTLEMVSYNLEGDDVTWENSYVRKWLNNDFLNMAFNEEEKKGILNSTVETCYSLDGTVNSGRETQDKLFLLSYEEVNKYFEPNRYGSFMLKYRISPYCSPGCEWWLRTPSESDWEGCMTYIRYDGLVGSCVWVTQDYLTVRPAMWINIAYLDSLNVEHSSSSQEMCGHHYCYAEVSISPSCYEESIVNMKCQQCGYTYEEIIPIEHTWVDATCTEPKKCMIEICGATEGEPLGHDPDEWGYCRVCNEQVRTIELKTSISEIYLDNKPETCTITIEGLERENGYCPDIYVNYCNNSIVNYSWGEWNGNSITLQLNPVETGTTQIIIALNDRVYREVYINVTSYVKDENEELR